MATSVHTWATLRAPIGNNSTFHTGNSARCNVTYGTTTGNLMFVSTEFSMVRTYINPLQPAIGAIFPDFYFRTSTNFNERATRVTGDKSLTEEQINQLIGETVTYTVGGVDTTFVMTADTWTFFGQTVSSTGPITAIGKLTLV